MGSYFCISLTDIGCKPDLLKDDAIGKRLLAYVMSGLEKEMAGKSRVSSELQLFHFYSTFCSSSCFVAVLLL